MSCCSVRWCGKNSKNSSYKANGITFHRFPKEPRLQEKWIFATKRENWLPTPYSVVCSRHFSEDCFDTTKNRRRLFQTAVPTQHLPLVGNTPVTKEPSEEKVNPIQVFTVVSPQFVPISNPPSENKQGTTPQFVPISRSRRNKQIILPQFVPISSPQYLPISSNPLNANEQVNSPQFVPISNPPSANKQVVSSILVPISNPPSENKQVILLQLVPISNPPSAIKQEPADPETDSEFDSMTKKRLCRRISDLSMKVTHKNKTLKVLRGKLRYLKKKMETLQGIIDEYEKGRCPVKAEDAEMKIEQAEEPDMKKEMVIIKIERL